MKKGDKVTVVSCTPFATVEENGIISKITKNRIFVDDSTIPFNKKTGNKVEVFSGCKCYIKEIAK